MLILEPCKWFPQIFMASHFKETTVSLSESTMGLVKKSHCSKGTETRINGMLRDNCRFDDRFTGRHDKFQTFLKLLDHCGLS